jgi:ubiquinone/menaquinone biosynthesis C-methylase UbiE
MTKTNSRLLIFYLKQYLRHRPLFLSLIRSKEAFLFSKYLKSGEPILDIGCGDGYFANMAFGGRRIDVGLDIPESRIAEAKTAGVYKKLVAYDGKKIPFDKSYFATAISNCVLEHVQDLKTVLSEVYRVLKPNGVFYTTVMTKEWENNLFGTLILGNLYKKWMRKRQVHRNLLTNKEWDLAFQKAGFIIRTRIGYLSPQACKLIDVCHYLSLVSLATYKLFGKWVVFPWLTKYLYPAGYLAAILRQETKTAASGALFYVLTKSNYD